MSRQSGWHVYCYVNFNSDNSREVLETSRLKPNADTVVGAKVCQHS